MIHSKTTLAAVGFSVLLLPCYLSAQEPYPSGSERPAQQQKLGESEPGSGRAPTHSQTRQPDLSSQEASPAIPSSSNTLISVQALTNSKVLDADHKEMGSVKNIMVDPKTGKLVRADISLGGGVLGAIGGGEQRFSVPWDQLSLKRQDNAFVLVLNEQAVEKIRAKKEETKNPSKQQRPTQNDQKN